MRSRGRLPVASRLRVELVGGGVVAARGLDVWLQAVAPAAARGQVTVAITGDARVRTLNHRFLGKPYATDVLSFPAGVAGELGDIVIAEGVARRQARVAGHRLSVELRVLALHGLLHLLGYDHEHDDGEMAALERRLRLKGGLQEGLIERAAPGQTVRPRRSRR